jgi:hypothetical protein
VKCSLGGTSRIFKCYPMIRFLGFDSRGLENFLLTTASRTALGSTQPPIQWVPGALSQGVKRPGCEADHSPPSSAEVIEWMELYIHSPNTPSWRGAHLKHRDNFTLPYLTLSRVMVFWVITPCSDAVEYQRFGGPCSLNFQASQPRRPRTDFHRRENLKSLIT